MAERISLHVNGTSRQVEVEPDTPLLYVLRNDLGLKGAKFGCGLEQCGACAVLVDGRAALSCREPVSAFVGRQVTTLEGLGTADALHPVQEAFLEERAAQCGYCTSGLIVAATALLHENAAPSEHEIREALAIHLCRCGAHARVIAAVKRAARSMAQ